MRYDKIERKEQLLVAVFQSGMTLDFLLGAVRPLVIDGYGNRRETTPVPEPLEMNTQAKKVKVKKSWFELRTGMDDNINLYKVWIIETSTAVES